MRFLFAVVLVLISKVGLASETLTEDFEKHKQKIEQAELKQRQVLSALYQLNKKIKKIVMNRGETDQQRAFLDVNIRQLSQKLEELDANSRSQKALLAERLRAIYKLRGGSSVARFLISSDNSNSLERNLKILGVVAARDLDLIRNYNRDLIELKLKRRTLDQRLASLKKVEAKIASQELDLRREQQTKSKILDGIRRTKMFALNEINDLREKSRQLSGEDSSVFDTLFKPSFADQKGQLPSPLQGLVVQRFGLVKGEDHPYTLLQKGVFISAAYGTPIKSVFDGKVSYIGDLSGFGKTLIVDHGDHYYSVYAHMKDVLVQVGDEIAQSQTLAQVGESSRRPDTGLYFEIRHFSEPYDPQQWMKGL